MHDVAPAKASVFVTLPAAQTEQLDDPALAENVPLSHARQVNEEVWPEEELEVPAAHA